MIIEEMSMLSDMSPVESLEEDNNTFFSNNDNIIFESQYLTFENNFCDNTTFNQYPFLFPANLAGENYYLYQDAVVKEYKKHIRQQVFPLENETVIK